MKKIVVWAQIRNHTGMKCVNPFLLPCGYIEPGTEVQMEEVDQTVYEYDMQLENAKPYSKLQGSVFFIANGDRKKKRGMTKVHYSELRHRDICVFANVSQTYKEALALDHLFKNVDYFSLRLTLAEGGATIDINEKPADFPKEALLDVKVNKDAPATDGKTAMTMDKRNYSVASTSTAEPTNGVSVSKTPRKKVNLNKLTSKMVDENALYVFSKDVDNLTTGEMLSEMDDCLKARAWSTRVGPTKQNYDKALTKLASVQFANHSVVARPIRITKTLVELCDSIGFLECGGITATCFLLSKGMIATNSHVVKKIKTARKSSTPHDHSEAYVYFDHEKIKRPLSGGHKLRPFSYPGNIISKQLDYALLCLEDYIEEKLPLGPFVRCSVPDQGNVCIVGHPNGEEKQEELCPILPLHEGRRSSEIERRLAENEQRYGNSPLVSTVYMYCPNVRKLYGDKAHLTYDVSGMFEGSSGAPVFDMRYYYIIYCILI